VETPAVRVVGETDNRSGAAATTVRAAELVVLFLTRKAKTLPDCTVPKVTFPLFERPLLNACDDNTALPTDGEGLTPPLSSTTFIAVVPE
jgi:hypothetical protein